TPHPPGYGVTMYKLSGARFIVNNQHAKTINATEFDRFRSTGRYSRQWYEKTKSGPMALNTRDTDFATHHLHKPLRDAQSESSSAIFTRRGLVRLSVRLEELTNLVLRKPDASIRDRE